MPLTRWPTLLLPFLALVACGDKDGGSDGSGGDEGAGDTGNTGDEDTGPVDADGDGHAVDDDCDDTDASVHPGADERCNGIDDDCDGTVDEDPVDGSEAHVDADGDGYGDPEQTGSFCEDAEGWSADATDCDDTDPTVYPGAEERCDGVDNDCDGAAEEATTVPDDHATIEEAVDAAVDGDLICIAPGTYLENVFVHNKALRIEGSGEPEDVVISPYLLGPAFRWSDTTTGTGVLRRVTLTGATNDDFGGGLKLDGGTYLVEDIVVRGNRLTGNGRLYGAGVAIHQEADATLRNVLIEDNTLETEEARSAEGAGLFVDMSKATLEDVVVRGNTCTTDCEGAGAYLYYSEVSWSGGEVSGNQGTDAAIWIEGLGGAVLLEHLLVAGNGPVEGGTARSGGLYLFRAPDVVLRNVIVAGNEVSGDEVEAAGITVYREVGLTLENVDIVGNVATGTSSVGAGGLAVLEYNVGGQGSEVSLINTVIAHNTTNDDAGAIAFSGSTNSIEIAYSAFYDNTWPDFRGLDDPTGSDGNLEADPLYADISSSDPLDWDLTLSTGSSLIDAGDPSILDSDGSVSDMGAHGGPGGQDW